MDDSINHEKYMQVALDHAREALERGEFPVGAVIVLNGQIVATGKREHSRKQNALNEIDHAEILALRSYIEQGRAEAMDEVTVYSTMEPCLMCYSTMILNGIRNIVYAYEDVMGGGTNLPLEQLNPLYAQMSVNVTAHILRDESIELFKRFFINPENIYWKDSLLERYTLSLP